MYQQVMLMHLILHVCAKFGDSVSKHLKRAFPQSRGVVSSIAELVPAHLLPSTAKYPEKLKKTKCYGQACFQNSFYAHSVFSTECL